MSWFERIQTEYVITTGDGRKHYPFWVKASYGVEWNVTQFDFPNKAGTLAKRGQPKGRTFPIEIYFQGDDHLDEAESFRISANDPRNWVITHPLYGSLTVCPVSMDANNDDSNVTVFTIPVIETITEDNPQLTVSPIDKIAADVTLTNESLSISFGNDVTPRVPDVNDMARNNQTLYSAGAKVVKNDIDAEAYFNAFNTANSAIINATAEPLAAIRTIQSVITYPALFKNAVRERIALFTSQMNSLRLTLSGIADRNQKKLFENNAGSLIAAVSLASANPIDGDYGNRSNVIASISPLVSMYNQYIVDLDSLQSTNGGSIDSYIPDADSLIRLNELVNFTIANLFDIALGAKQERSIMLEEDSNIIILAHRLYGLTPDDKTIEDIINQNNLGINSILQIRKGERIIYYV